MTPISKRNFEARIRNGRTYLIYITDGGKKYMRDVGKYTFTEWKWYQNLIQNGSQKSLRNFARSIRQNGQRIA